MPTEGRIKRRKLYQEVLDRLISSIATESPPGSLLPSERDLMQRYGVGRPAIREAMHALQQMGLLRISHGERARVVTPTTDAIMEQMTNGFVMMLATNPRGLDELKEARSPGSPLCRLFSSDPAIDGFEIALNGGQMGTLDFFGSVRAGRAIS